MACFKEFAEVTLIKASAPSVNKATFGLRESRMSTFKNRETWSSLGLAFVGGYADASSYLLAQTFTGHITGNSILAAVSLVNREWSISMDRFLAIASFICSNFFTGCRKDLDT